VAHNPVVLQLVAEFLTLSTKICTYHAIHIRLNLPTKRYFPQIVPFISHIRKIVLPTNPNQANPYADSFRTHSLEQSHSYQVRDYEMICSILNKMDHLLCLCLQSNHYARLFDTCVKDLHRMQS
jgi:hypothetical protein